MKKILLFLSLIFLFSCGDTVAGDSTREFTDNRWPKTDVKTFELELEEDIDDGSLAIEFSHVYEPLFNRVPLRITVKGPDGAEEILKTDLMLENENGEYLSDCSGDICDLEQVIKSNIPLKKGVYKISIENNFPTDYVPNVIRLGVNMSADMKAFGVNTSGHGEE